MSKRTLVILGLLVVVVIIFVARGGKNSSAQGGSSGQCQVQVVADVLNVRSSPDGNASVVQKLSSGTTVGASSTVQAGYRELSDGHWAATQFLKNVSGNC
ncbi:MAG TPA: SH3 domain-containing protein [Pseudonocardiaceae bacterium]|jgi:hypothetical protein|nr:SH3 domain-containing protein [Pseudonocardiaceae bacterium]